MEKSMADLLPKGPGKQDGQTRGNTQGTYGEVLIDLENLFFSRKDFKKATMGSFYEASDLIADLKFLLQWISLQFNGSKLRVLRAYTPSQGFGLDDSDGKKVPYRPEADLQELGIEPVIVPALAKRKNSIDMRIAVDAMSYGVPSAQPHWILLVGGDSDYIPVVLALRQAGSDVIVVGFKNPPGKKEPQRWYVPKFAGEFYFFEQLVDEQHQQLVEEVKKEVDEQRNHTAQYYLMVLQNEEPRFFLVSPEDWVDVTNAIADLGKATMTMENLVAQVRLKLDAHSSETSAVIGLVVKQLWDSGCLRPADDAQGAWEGPLSLAPEFEVAEAIRLHTQKKIAFLLRQRLTALGDQRPLDKQALAELLFCPKPSPSHIAAAEQLIAGDA
jgi:uncharacterized LabA/DUF88 family protein